MDAFDSLIWTLWEVRFLTSGRLVSGGSPISGLGVMQSLSPCKMQELGVTLWELRLLDMDALAVQIDGSGHFGRPDWSS